MKLTLKSKPDTENSKEVLTMNTQLNYNDDVQKYAKCLDGEKWEKIMGFDNYYVSDKGRIFSSLQKKILKPDLQKSGYFDVRLKSNDGSFIHQKIHRLVGCAFCPNPEHKPIIHHKNGNSRNNSKENIMFVTNSEHWELHRVLREEKKKKKALEDDTSEEKGATTNESGETN